MSGAVSDAAAGSRPPADRPGLAARLYVPLLAIAAGIASTVALSRLDLGTPGWPTFVVLAAAAALSRLAAAKLAPGCKDSCSLPFVFAGAVLLPPPFVAPLAVARHALDWAGDEHRVQEEVFTVSRTTLSALCAAGVCHLLTTTSTSTPWSLAAVAAAATFVTVSALVDGARGVLTGEPHKTDLLGDAVVAAVGVGFAVAWHSEPWLAPFALLPLIAVHRSVEVTRLRSEAAVDAKTGLFNPRHFGIALDGELARARRLERPVALLMADLDLLREVNNTYGHLAGDAVLAGVADVIRRALRPYDIGARFGGEEFAVLLPETGAQEALEVANRIRRGVAASRFVPNETGKSLRVTISIGIAVFPDDAADAEKLLHRADLAVYRAKVQGRNRVHAAGDDPLTDQSPLRLAGSEPSDIMLPEPVIRPIGGLRDRLPPRRQVFLWLVPRVAALGIAAVVLGLLAGVPRWLLALCAVALIPTLAIRRRHPPLGYETALRAQEVWRAAESMNAHTRSVEKLNRTLLENSTAAMETLTAVVDARDAHTAGHSRRVQRLSLAIGRALELSRPELDVLATASLFHDLGKLSVPEAILLKPDPLDTHEWRIVQRHPSEGARLLERLGFLSDALPAIRHHHERYDGSGYPDGLQGEDIPLGARIINVADALDAMLTSRVYRPALSPLDALAELKAGAGTQFCPRCVAAVDRVVLAEFAKGADPTSPDVLAAG